MAIGSVEVSVMRYKMLHIDVDSIETTLDLLQIQTRYRGISKPISSQSSIQSSSSSSK